MPTVTDYIFFQGFYNGMFTGVSRHVASIPTADIGLSVTPKGTVEANRPDSEHATPLRAALNQQQFLGEVAKILNQPFIFWSTFEAIRAQAVSISNTPWPVFLGLMPLVIGTGPLQLVVRLSTVLKFTPPGVTDADVTISFYTVVKLNAQHHLVVQIAGTWVEVDGGWPDGQKIADGFGVRVKALVPVIQHEVNRILTPVSGASFRNVYLLPGDGSRAPVSFGNASFDVAIAVVP
jgi:hypothetical protein